MKYAKVTGIFVKIWSKVDLVAKQHQTFRMFQFPLEFEMKETNEIDSTVNEIK